MAVTREKPVDRDDPTEPITDAPKLTRAQQERQHKRELAGIGILRFTGFLAARLGKVKVRGRRLLNVLPEDVIALAVHAPSIAKAAADAALEDQRMAMALDFLARTGPYGALFEAASAFGMQVAANHNKGVRDGSVDPAQFGAVHPSKLLTMAGVASPNGNGDGDPVGA